MRLNKDLIEELQMEHKQIVAVLEKVKQVGISSPEAKDLLLKAKTGLLNHLRKEDNNLYPVLNFAASKDIALKGTLDRFSTEMKEIASVALAFFAKYESNYNVMEFSRDFGKLYATLGMRISREESILYAKYNELVENA